MLDVARKISHAAASAKKGIWEKAIGTDVCFKKLGIIGLGAIGRNVAKRAKGFDMDIYAYDPFVTGLSEEFSHVKLVSLEEAIKQADFLTLHIPLNDSTRNLIGKAGWR